MKNRTAFTLYRREHSPFNHLTLWVLIPSIRIREDLDYMTYETGISQVEIELPTSLIWRTDSDFWTVGVRLLGFGFTLTRQTA